MMFILSFLTFIYGLVCFLTVILILIQRSKSSMGLGNVGGGNQALFGNSGGQDIFQKITWFFLVIILSGSLFLAVLKGKSKVNRSAYFPKQSRQEMPADNQSE